MYYNIAMDLHKSKLSVVYSVTVIGLLLASVVQCHSVPDKRQASFRHDHEHETEEHKEFEKKVILGDEDSAAFDKLSRDDKVKKLRGVAEKADTNKDGYISSEELEKWVKDNHMKYLVKDSIRYVLDVDLDNDTQMSFKEYEMSHYVPGTPGMPENYRNTTRYKHAKRRFEYADTDNDGKLSVIEFLYFLHPEEGKHMRKALVLETIENMDYDGDGALNIKDYIGEGILEIENGEEFVEKVKEFKGYDKNVDGLLVEEEVYDWMFPSDHSTSRHEVEHIMSYGDKNKDGRLSYEEFSSIPEHLEQSKATGYGELFDDSKDEL